MPEDLGEKHQSLLRLAIKLPHPEAERLPKQVTARLVGLDLVPEQHPLEALVDVVYRDRLAPTVREERRLHRPVRLRLLVPNALMYRVTHARVDLNDPLLAGLALVQSDFVCVDHVTPPQG